MLEAFRDEPVDYARKGRRRAGATRPGRFADFPSRTFKSASTLFFLSSLRGVVSCLYKRRCARTITSAHKRSRTGTPGMMF